jgi:hypothetical protein
MGTEQNLIQSWLNTARWAASGGNAQAWIVEYELSPKKIKFILSIDPTYIPKHSPLDVNGTATVFSLGALALNLKVLAAEDNYNLIGQNYDEKVDFWQSRLHLEFELGGVGTNYELSSKDILNRQTNRMPYHNLGIGQGVVDKINSCAKKYQHLKIFEIKPEVKTQFVKTLIPLENIRWQSTAYLDSLFSEINFEIDIQAHPDKIPISQLGLNSMDQSFFKFLKGSPFLKNLFQKFLYKTVTPKALLPFSKYCDRLYAVQASEFSFTQCVELGSFFQEVWIEINKLGASFQPWGTPLVALGYFQKESLVSWKPERKQTVVQVSEQVKEKYQIDLQVPVMVFRTGWAKENHARAPRKKLEGRAISQLKHLVS